MATRWRCPPRESARVTVHVLGEPDPLQQLPGPRHALAALHSLDEERPRHVLHRGQHRDQVKRLEHEAELCVPEAGERPIVLPVEVHAVDPDANPYPGGRGRR